MIGWNEVPERDFASLYSVPAKTLSLMYAETKQEVEAVVEDGREQAAKRNGHARIAAHMVARGLL